MLHDSSNVIELPLGRSQDRRDAPVETGETGTGLCGDAQAIASCLDYLYGEALKLDKRMTAHLIGAAAESLRQESGDSENG